MWGLQIFEECTQVTSELQQHCSVTQPTTCVLLVLPYGAYDSHDPVPELWRKHHGSIVNIFVQDNGLCTAPYFILQWMHSPQQGSLKSFYTPGTEFVLVSVLGPSRPDQTKMEPFMLRAIPANWNTKAGFPEDRRRRWTDVKSRNLPESALQEHGLELVSEKPLWQPDVCQRARFLVLLPCPCLIKISYSVFLSTF